MRGRSRWKKPGLIVTFDDGLDSQYDAARVLEKAGANGWFFLPTELIGQKGRLTWEQARQMQKRHVIGGHTRSHLRLSGKYTRAVLRNEIAGCKDDLEGHGIKPHAFAWVGGELYSYSAKAAGIINSEFQYVFQTCSWPITKSASTKHLHRTNIESNYPHYLVLFQLSGIMDLAYLPKRLVVQNITNTSQLLKTKHKSKDV
jgi:peptidoglycan/xylan/chitin deacetylase (PgdA/CDA1 family)